MATTKINKGKEMKLKVVEDAQRLKDFKESRPYQLELFKFLQAKEDQYSNAFEMYDLAPKYFYGKPKRIDGRFLDTLERNYKHNTEDYKLYIRPARITKKDGSEIEYYPGKREEFIEEALRKLACSDKNRMLDDLFSIVVSFYEIQQELKSMGHSYSYPQIKEGLLIMRRSGLTINKESKDGSTSMLDASFLETVGLREWEDLKKGGKQGKIFIRFNSLITSDIKKLKFRQYNYHKQMHLKNYIARWIHKKLNLRFTQANHFNDFNIMASTIMDYTGMVRYSNFRNNIRDIKKALEELIKHNIIRKYDEKAIYEEKQNRGRNKLIDVKFSLHASHEFVKEMKQSNWRVSELKSAKLQAENPSQTKGKKHKEFSKVGEVLKGLKK